MIQKTFLLALAVSLFASLPADGAGLSSDTQDGPLVVRTLPLDVTENAPSNTEIRVFFDRRMERDTFDDNFEIRAAGGGIISWTGWLEGNGTVFAAKPTPGLPGDRTIIVRLDHGITDIDGNPIEDLNDDEPGAYEFDFTSGFWTDYEPPEVSQIEIFPNPTHGADQLTLRAWADDSERGGVIIGWGEFFVDNLGPNGGGFPLNADDGIFNETAERIRGVIDSSEWSTEPFHLIFVHAMDATGNWSDLISIIVYTEGGDFFYEDDVFVWPNPARDQATFTFTVGGDSRVGLVVYDLAGRVVHRDSGSFLSGDRGEFVWDLSGVASDVYIFRLYAEETSGQLRSTVVVKKLAVIR